MREGSKGADLTTQTAAAIDALPVDLIALGARSIAHFNYYYNDEYLVDLYKIY